MKSGDSYRPDYKKDPGNTRGHERGRDSQRGTSKDTRGIDARIGYRDINTKVDHKRGNSRERYDGRNISGDDGSVYDKRNIIDDKTAEVLERSKIKSKVVTYDQRLAIEISAMLEYAESKISESRTEIEKLEKKISEFAALDLEIRESRLTLAKCKNDVLRSALEKKQQNKELSKIESQSITSFNQQSKLVDEQATKYLQLEQDIETSSSQISEALNNARKEIDKLSKYPSHEKTYSDKKNVLEELVNKHAELKKKNNDTRLAIEVREVLEKVKPKLSESRTGIGELEKKINELAVSGFNIRFSQRILLKGKPILAEALKKKQNGKAIDKEDIKSIIIFDRERKLVEDRVNKYSQLRKDIETSSSQISKALENARKEIDNLSGYPTYQEVYNNKQKKLKGLDNIYAKLKEKYENIRKNLKEDVDKNKYQDLCKISREQQVLAREVIDNENLVPNMLSKMQSSLDNMKRITVEYKSFVQSFIKSMKEVEELMDNGQSSQGGDSGSIIQAHKKKQEERTKFKQNYYDNEIVFSRNLEKSRSEEVSSRLSNEKLHYIDSMSGQMHWLTEDFLASERKIGKWFDEFHNKHQSGWYKEWKKLFKTYA